MEKTIKVVQEIDFNLLRKQKEELLRAITFLEENAQYEDPDGREAMKFQIESLTGILNMIDNIQDAVVADGFKTEKEVFNLSDD